jgi:hypothetical protein
VQKPSEGQRQVPARASVDSPQLSGQGGLPPGALGRGGQRQASVRGDPEASRAAPRVRSTLELIGLVVAPTTLLTGLAYYFGWTLTNARASYFGIDPSTLGFSMQDYLLRSADALFVPLSAVVFAALAALAIHAVVSSRLSERSRTAILRASWLCGAAGSVLLALGIVAVFRPLPFPTHYLFAPVSPGLGAALLAYAVYLRRGWLSPLAVGLVAALVVLSTFWTASKYADALGRGRAKKLERSLSTRPSVVVYAKQRLHLDRAKETRLGRHDSAYAFRYDGLRLLVRSGGKYFLVPDDWSRENGVAILLPDTDELRLEFSPGR